MSDEQSGLVVQSTGSWYSVSKNDGTCINCKFKGKYKISGIKSTNPIAVGDKVKFIFVDEDNTGLITKIEPRFNYVIRKSTRLSKQEQIIASNIDQCIIFASIKQPRTSTGFIDRFLTCNEAYHIPSIIVFNKIDIYDKVDFARLNELCTIYGNVGYPTYKISVVEQDGIEVLKNVMKDMVTLLSGHSGVGKSALIKAIQPEISLKIGEISKVHEKGKHTTTHATMYPLSFGGYLVDTPGIKEFGLTGFDKHEVAERFPEMRKLQNDCKFNNCTHVNEPGCAIIKAVANGEISSERYNNYLGMLQDDYYDDNDYDN